MHSSPFGWLSVTTPLPVIMCIQNVTNGCDGSVFAINNPRATGSNSAMVSASSTLASCQHGIPIFDMLVGGSISNAAAGVASNKSAMSARATIASQRRQTGTHTR